MLSRAANQGGFRDAIAARFNNDGTLDTTFDGVGYVIVDLSDGVTNYSAAQVSGQVTRATDGRLYLSGTRGVPSTAAPDLTGSSQQIVIARLTSDPTYTVTTLAVSVNESQPTASVTVTRTGATSGAASVNYTL